MDETRTRGTVLIVEDDPDVSRFIAINLRSVGWETVEVSDGNEALSRAEEVRPAIVLLDVGLPHVDGFRVALQIRANPGTAAAGIIFLTGRAQSNEKVMGLTIGDDYIVKPFDPIELLARVENVRRRGVSGTGRADG
jgi:DNA-binding response OmpR family regulator